MNRYYQFLFLIISITILFGCFAQKPIYDLRENQILIDAGMSKQEVIDIMGVPGDRQLNGELEAWQYCSSSFTTFEYIVVWFYNRKVGSVITYKDQTCLAIKCEQCFRSVDFQTPPNAIIELRTKNITK